MNILIALALMLSVSFAGTQEVSQKIASSYQNLMLNVKDGRYSISLLATYDFTFTDETTGTLPVFLMPPQDIRVPMTVESCAENTGSISCSIAQYLSNWLKQVQPSGTGTFRLELALQGNGIIKEATVYVDRSELD